MSISLIRRIKEIGIRRIHGAGSINLILLFLKDFLWQFTAAGILACVFAYYFLTHWLESFQYKIGLPFYVFVVIHLAILIMISVLITAYSWRAIAANPVKALRSE
jgi:putative ABC transport system permease protein